MIQRFLNNVVPAQAGTQVRTAATTINRSHTNYASNPSPNRSARNSTNAATLGASAPCL